MRLRKETKEMTDEELVLTAQISDALGHPARLRLFRFIYMQNATRKTVCTKDLVEQFDYAQSTISQHMKKLAESGLIEVKKEEKFSYYYVNVGVLARYVNAVKKFG